jgi:hypothetical protein
LLFLPLHDFPFFSRSSLGFRTTRHTSIRIIESLMFLYRPIEVSRGGRKESGTVKPAERTGQHLHTGPKWNDVYWFFPSRNTALVERASLLSLCLPLSCRTELRLDFRTGKKRTGRLRRTDEILLQRGLLFPLDWLYGSENPNRRSEVRTRISFVPFVLFGKKTSTDILRFTR